MLRCLSVAVALTALNLAVPVWSQEKKDDEKPKVQKTDGVDLEALFKKLDTDGDGKISLEEFKKLPELYKPATAKGKGGKGKGNFDPEQIKKLLEKFGGEGGNFDPEQLKKLIEKFGGKGGIDPEQLKKLKEKFGGKDGGAAFDPEAIKGIIEQIGGQAGNFDPAQIQELIQNVIGGAGLERKLKGKKNID